MNTLDTVTKQALTQIIASMVKAEISLENLSIIGEKNVQFIRTFLGRVNNPHEDRLYSRDYLDFFDEKRIFMSLNETQKNELLNFLDDLIQKIGYDEKPLFSQLRTWSHYKDKVDPTGWESAAYFYGEGHGWQKTRILSVDDVEKGFVTILNPNDLHTYGFCTNSNSPLLLSKGEFDDLLEAGPEFLELWTKSSRISRRSQEDREFIESFLKDTKEMMKNKSLTA